MNEERPWPEASNEAFHLTPTKVWERQADADGYLPEAYDVGGFIHLTIGEVNLLAVANAFYQNDYRAHVVLVLDLGRLTAPVRFEDEGHIYPHVYGPLNRDAVVDVRRTIRLADGSFIGIE
ncbi:MAG: DUF952 domain-containing protein [Chloroflexota bacterium]|nr:DUF952 domain-containing protein [Chloroflexota bacterium]